MVALLLLLEPALVVLVQALALDLGSLLSQ